MAPATAARCPAAAIAICAAFWLIAKVWSASMCCASLTGFAPNVLVSITSAPAAT